MKYFQRIALAVFVIGAYVLYGWHQRSADIVAGGAQGSPNIIPNVPPHTATTPPALVSGGYYKNGNYTGSVANSLYGDIQVRATISGARITDVKFLQYPNDRPQSIDISNQAMPKLKQEAISAQSANVDVVTGATDTSAAFIKSLGAALAAAH